MLSGMEHCASFFYGNRVVATASSLTVGSVDLAHSVRLVHTLICGHRNMTRSHSARRGMPTISVDWVELLHSPPPSVVIVTMLLLPHHCCHPK